MSFYRDKMTLELRKTETDAINALCQLWSVNQQFELEAIVKNVGLTGFLDVSARLRAVGLEEEAQQPVLNIMMPQNLRFTIAGIGPIQAYCTQGNLTNIPYSVTIKERIQIVDQIDLIDYNARVKLRREVPISITNPKVLEVVSKWGVLPKQFRLLNRFTYRGPPDSGFHYDLSIIRESQKDSRQNYIGVEKLTMEQILSRPQTYEVECELDRHSGNDSTTVTKNLLRGLGLMLQGIQRSYVLVRKPISEDVISFVASVIGIRIGTFPGPLPSTLELANISVDKETNVENIRFGNYNVTDKADGLRCLLVVSKNGKLYLMDSGKNVYGTGLFIQNPSLYGTILDGEWVKTNKKGDSVSAFYAFDIYTFGSKKVYDLMFTSESGDNRFTMLKNAVDDLSSGANSYRDIPTEHATKILMKQFYTLPGSIFENALLCLENSKVNDYYVDGLIFTPNNKPLPINGKGWSSQFKWKPSQDNTIDFLVSIEKDETGADKIESTFNNSEREYVKHKTLRLFVGGNQDPAFKDPRDTILNNKSIPEIMDDDTYRPLPFTPSLPVDPEASICNIAIDTTDANTNIYCTRNKDIISDRCIVEMAYRPENPARWRWEPLRIRWDKTERLQRGEIARTMNADWVADSIWSSIHNPITENMIRTGILNEGLVEKPVVYYQKRPVERNNFIIKGHNKFHNEHIKSEILLKSVLKRGDALLDLSCGRGGDILKWIKNEVSWVLGVDINLDCLNAPKIGAYGRYLDLIVKNTPMPPMIFVQADSSKNIKDSSAGTTQLDQKILQTLYERPSVDQVPPFVEALRGLAAKKFDVVSSMFSLHYYFKDRETVDGFLTNVADNLKVGGYFVGCCFDGDTVFKHLHQVNQGGTIKDTNQNVWAIRRGYGPTDFLESTDSGLGKAIDVFFMSIGEEHREYLVSWKYLVERMNEIGCELLQPNEIVAMGLRSSSEMFGQSYKYTGSKYIMNSALQQFSFMNRWFIFRRRREASISIQEAPAVQTGQMGGYENPNVEQNNEMVIDMTDDMPVEKGVDNGVDNGVDKPINITIAEASVPVMEETEKPLTTSNRPTFKFYHGSTMKDDLGLGLSNWARYLSTFTYSKLKDRNDPNITYPSLEAAFASERFKQSTDRPELGPGIFGFTENLHQKYEKLRRSNTVSEKDVYKLIEDEGIEIREFLKPNKMKQLGATWDENKWREIRNDAMSYYIKQRYENDKNFKLILDKLKEMDARIVYYNGTRPSDMGGLIRDDGTVDGKNQLGNLYMAVVGLEP